MYGAKRKIPNDIAEMVYISSLLNYTAGMLSYFNVLDKE